jgi:hypothetical protein
MTGLLGTGPPSDAAPRGPRVEARGRGVCSEIKRNAQPVLQTPIACPTGACQLGNARTRMSLAARGAGNTGRPPFGHLCV